MRFASDRMPQVRLRVHSKAISPSIDKECSEARKSSLTIPQISSFDLLAIVHSTQMKFFVLLASVVAALAQTQPLIITTPYVVQSSRVYNTACPLDGSIDLAYQSECQDVHRRYSHLDGRYPPLQARHCKRPVPSPITPFSLS